MWRLRLLPCKDWIGLDDSKTQNIFKYFNIFHLNLCQNPWYRSSHCFIFRSHLRKRKKIFYLPSVAFLPFISLKLFNFFTWASWQWLSLPRRWRSLAWTASYRSSWGPSGTSWAQLWFLPGTPPGRLRIEWAQVPPWCRRRRMRPPPSTTWWGRQECCRCK